MYVVGISGSPRKNGNTSILVNEVLKHIKGEKMFISLAELDLNPCVGCNKCWHEKKECFINDDITWIIRELEKCDAVILGSPSYFGSMSAQLKMLIDRSVSTFTRRSFRNKILGAVALEDALGAGAGGDLTLASIRNTYSGDFIYAGGIVGSGGVEMDNVNIDKQALENAKNLAERINELYEIMAKKNGDSPKE